MQKLIQKIRDERGDTIVEVMIALAVLSASLMITLTIMSRSQSNLLEGINRTEIRAAINSQSELLNYFHDSYNNSQWKLIKEKIKKNTETIETESCTTNQGYSFYIDNNNVVKDLENNGQNINPREHPVAPGNGIWIDAVRNTTNELPYIDFYIKACWSSLVDFNQSRSSTVVRIYDEI